MDTDRLRQYLKGSFVTLFVSLNLNPLPLFYTSHSNHPITTPGADPGFEKGGFNLVPKRDTGGATSTY